MNRLPDVEAIFEFNGTRTNPAADGYRPAHLITGNYLTSEMEAYLIERLNPELNKKKEPLHLYHRRYIHTAFGLGRKSVFKKVRV